MLYLASGVLCVDSSENQLEDFGDSPKGCDFMRKYNESITVYRTGSMNETLNSDL